jgi:hypothetical protein
MENGWRPGSLAHPTNHSAKSTDSTGAENQQCHPKVSTQTVVNVPTIVIAPLAVALMRLDVMFITI